MDPIGEGLYDCKVGTKKVYDAINDAPLDELLALIESLPEITASVRIIGEKAEHRAGELMGGKSVVVDGVEWVRSQPPDRKKFDSEALLMAVLDSRLVNPETGELVEETQLDRVRDVYPLAGYNARVTRLRARGIDLNAKNADGEGVFCETSWDNRPYRVMRADKKARFKK